MINEIIPAKKSLDQHNGTNLPIPDVKPQSADGTSIGWENKSTQDKNETPPPRENNSHHRRKEIIPKTNIRSYTRESLGMYESGPPIEIIPHQIPVKEKKAIIEIAEYIPHKLIEQNKSKGLQKTLIIFGGGASPGLGTNIKLAPLIEEALIKQLKNGPVPNISKILIAPNPSGAPKDKSLEDKDDLSMSAELIREGLGKMGVTFANDTILMGYSAGGNLALHLAALFDKERKDKEEIDQEKQGSTDLILIEATGTMEYSKKRMAWEFVIGDSLKNFRNYLQYMDVFEALAKAREDYRIGWASRDGVPSWGRIVKEIIFAHPEIRLLIKQSNIENKANMAANLGILGAFNTKKITDDITGNVLMVRFSGSKMIGNTTTHLWQEKLFSKAKSRATYPLKGITHHGAFMTDDFPKLEKNTKSPRQNRIKSIISALMQGNVKNAFERRSYIYAKEQSRIMEQIADWMSQNEKFEAQHSAISAPAI